MTFDLRKLKKKSTLNLIKLMRGRVVGQQKLTFLVFHFIHSLKNLIVWKSRADVGSISSIQKSAYILNIMYGYRNTALELMSGYEIKSAYSSIQVYPWGGHKTTVTIKDPLINVFYCEFNSQILLSLN